jgi:hypothetical protein
LIEANYASDTRTGHARNFYKSNDEFVSYNGFSISFLLVELFKFPHSVWSSGTAWATACEPGPAKENTKKMSVLL